MTENAPASDPHATPTDSPSFAAQAREAAAAAQVRRPLRDQMTDRRDELAEAVNANTARDFGALLRLLENGKLHREISAQYHELIDELRRRSLDTGQEITGTLNLAIGFTLKNGTCAIQADSSIKTPKRKRELSMMFLTPENNLSRLNPDQLELFQDRGVRSV